LTVPGAVVNEGLPLVAVIYATWAASAPVVDAFAAQCPDAQLWQLLDDHLTAEAIATGIITTGQIERLRRLAGYAAAGGADAMLLTCSMYAGYAESVGAAVGIRMLPSDGALHRSIVQSGHTRAIVLYSQRSVVEGGESRLRAAASASNVALDVLGIVAPRALEATAVRDWSGVAQVLEAVARPHVTRGTAVALGQYSLAPAAAELSQRLGIEVLSGPLLAAREMRSVLWPTRNVPEGPTRLSRTRALMIEGGPRSPHRPRDPQ
jgi:hypothetical protein